jgi:hypothetical protein
VTLKTLVLRSGVASGKWQNIAVTAVAAVYVASGKK